MSKRLKATWSHPPGYDTNKSLDQLWEESKEIRAKLIEAMKHDQEDEGAWYRLHCANIDNTVQRYDASGECIGEYIDFMGAVTRCMDSGEGCMKPGCKASRTPTGGW